MIRARRLIHPPALAAAGLLALACGGDAQEPGDAASSATGDKPSWTAEATPSPGKEGAEPERPHVPNAASIGAKLPPNFPEDVPQYPGAEVSDARSVVGQGLAVSLTSDDDSDKVASFYADTFAARGWETDIRRTPDGHMIFADKGKRAASALVHPGADGAGTQVELIVVAR